MAKAPHSKAIPKLDRREFHAGANTGGSALSADLVREVNEPERDLEMSIERSEASVTVPGADTDCHDQPNQRDISSIPGDYDGSMSAPSHVPVVSPNEGHVEASQGDTDVDMRDAQSHSERNSLLALVASTDIQTVSHEVRSDADHDVSMEMLHYKSNSMDAMPPQAMGPTSPMRTAVKRSASTLEDSGDYDRHQPLLEPEEAPQRKRAKIQSAAVPALAPAVTRRTRVLRPRVASRATSTATKAGAAATRGSKRATRALPSRAKSAAATRPTGVSALESGVRPSSSRSAAAAGVANGNGPSSYLASESNRLGRSNALHATVAAGGSTPTGVHMTRARTRALSGGNSSTSSDSAMGASLSGSTAVNTSTSGTNLTRSSSSNADDHFSCDVVGSVKAGGVGRQEFSHEDGGRSTTTTNAPKRGHMHRSGTNQSVSKISVPILPCHFWRPRLIAHETFTSLLMLLLRVMVTDLLFLHAHTAFSLQVWGRAWHSCPAISALLRRAKPRLQGGHRIILEFPR